MRKVFKVQKVCSNLYTFNTFTTNTQMSSARTIELTSVEIL